MPLKYSVVCIVLFLMVLFFAQRSYKALTHPLELGPNKGGSNREVSAGGFPVVEAPKVPTSVASYNVIASRNIFSPERRDFAAIGSGISSKPVMRPQVILYGVTIAGDYRSASVVNPGRPLRKGEKEQMTVRLGERIGEYRLAKVLTDRITMEAGEDSFEVLLYDPKMPKKRVDTRTEGKPATIITSQTPSSPTSDVRGGSELPKDQGASTAVKKPASPKGAVGETKGPPPPGTTPAPMQPPSTMTPTPATSRFAPTPLSPPPGIGRPVPLPSGGSTTGGK